MARDKFKTSTRYRADPLVQARAKMVEVKDTAEEEVDNSLSEGRPLRADLAFPDPPPPISEQVAAGATPLAGLTEEWEGPSLESVLDQERERLQGAEKQELIVEGPVRRRSRMNIAPGPPEAPPPAPDPNASPSDRIEAVAKYSNNYLNEYRLKLLHRLLMRNLPLDTIAAQLNVSLSEVKRMRDELNRRLVYEAQTINRYEIAGRTLAFYDEVQGMALRMADAPDSKGYVKLQSLQTAMGAMADRQRFLATSGFWAAAPFTPMDAIEDESSRAAQKIHTLIEAVLDDSGQMFIDQDATDAANIEASDRDTKLL